MRLGKFSKEPGERKLYTIDYSDWLNTSETITGLSFNITPATTLVVDGDAIGSPATGVSFFVSGGTDGVSYTVEAVVTTSQGQIKEDQVLFNIKEY